jgi:hypothetical protein
MLSCRQIDDIVKMKRNKMKKIVALVAVLFSVVVPVQSQAAVGERIVIIDSYFDKTKITGSVEFICLATDKCVNTPNPKPGLGTDPVNHGTVMANIARQQNPTATLVLIQTEEVSSGIVNSVDITGQDFLNALNWVSKNANNVSAVSFSYNLTGNATSTNPCALSNNGQIAVRPTDQSIRTIIASLKNVNIPVFAAAGNYKTKSLQYPACIDDVVSVGSYSYGTQPYLYGGIPDITATLITPDKTRMMKTVSPWFGSVEFSTSAATVAVASNWKSIPAGSAKINILSN